MSENDNLDLSGEFLPEYIEDLDDSKIEENEMDEEEESSDEKKDKGDFESQEIFFDELNLNLDIFSDIDEENELDDYVNKRKNKEEDGEHEIKEKEETDEEDLEYIKRCINSLEAELEQKKLSLSMHQESETDSDNTPLYYSKKKKQEQKEEEKPFDGERENDLILSEASKRKIKRRDIEDVLCSPEKGIDALLKVLSNSEKKKRIEQAKKKKRKEKEEKKKKNEKFSSFFNPLDQSCESLVDLSSSLLEGKGEDAEKRRGRDEDDKSDNDHLYDLFPYLRDHKEIKAEEYAEREEIVREGFTMEALKRNWQMEEDDEGDEEFLEEKNEESMTVEKDNVNILEQDELFEENSGQREDLEPKINLEMSSSLQSPSPSIHHDSPHSTFVPHISSSSSSPNSSSPSKFDIRIHKDFSIWNESSKIDPYILYEEYSGIFPPISSYIRKKNWLIPLENSVEKKERKLEVVLPSIFKDTFFYPVHRLEVILRPDVELGIVMKSLQKVGKISGCKTIQTHRNRLFLFSPTPDEISEILEKEIEEDKTGRKLENNERDGKNEEDEEKDEERREKRKRDKGKVKNTANEKTPTTSSSFSSFFSSFTSSSNSSSTTTVSPSISTWEVADVQVILSRETRHRVILFQFMKKIYSSSTSSSTLRTLWNSLSLSHNLEPIQMPNKPRIELFKKNLYCKTWLRMLKREFFSSNLTLSSLYNLPLEKVLRCGHKKVENKNEVLVEEEEEEEKTYGLDLHYVSLLKTFYKEKMWISLKEEYKEREKKVERMRDSLSSFQSLLQQVYTKIHGRSPPPSSSPSSSFLFSDWKGEDVEKIMKELEVSSPINSPYLKLIHDQYEEDERDNTSPFKMMRSPRFKEIFSPSSISHFSPCPSSSSISTSPSYSLPPHLQSILSPQRIEELASLQKIDGMVIVLLIIDHLNEEILSKFDQEYEERLGKKSLHSISCIKSMMNYKKKLISCLINSPSSLSSPLNKIYHALFEEIYNNILPNKLCSSSLDNVKKTRKDLENISKNIDLMYIPSSVSPPPPIISETSSYWFKGWSIESITSMLLPEDSSSLGSSISRKEDDLFSPTFSINAPAHPSTSSVLSPPFSLSYSSSLDDGEKIPDGFIPKEDRKKITVEEAEKRLDSFEKEQKIKLDEKNKIQPTLNRIEIDNDETKDMINSSLTSTTLSLPPPREKVKTSILSSTSTTPHLLSLFPPFKSQTLLCVYECICNGAKSELLISQNILCILQIKDDKHIFINKKNSNKKRRSSITSITSSSELPPSSIGRRRPSISSISTNNTRETRNEGFMEDMEEEEEEELVIYSREAFLMKNFVRIDIGSEVNQIILTFSTCSQTMPGYITPAPSAAISLSSSSSSISSSSSTRIISLLIPPQQLIRCDGLSPYENLKILLPLLKDFK